MNAPIKPGQLSAGTPAALIEMLKYRIADPDVKVDYRVREVEPGSLMKSYAPGSRPAPRPNYALGLRREGRRAGTADRPDLET